MSLAISTAGSLTSPVVVDLYPAGVSPGKSVYVTEDNTRLVIRKVEFTSSTSDAKKDSLGAARAGIKVTFANRSAEEGCCTVTQGATILDFGLRWDLSQPIATVNDSLVLLAGILRSQECFDLLTKGVVPSA